jgi:hypothetical protein
MEFLLTGLTDFASYATRLTPISLPELYNELGQLSQTAAAGTEIVLGFF